MISTYISDGPDRYAELDKLAPFAPAGAEDLFMDPLLPCRLDLRENYSKAVMARAIMEGVSLRIKVWLCETDKLGIHISHAVMVGGPSDSNTWL